MAYELKASSCDPLILSDPLYWGSLILLDALLVLFQCLTQATEVHVSVIILNENSWNCFHFNLSSELWWVKPLKIMLNLTYFIFSPGVTFLCPILRKALKEPLLKTVYKMQKAFEFWK